MKKLTMRQKIGQWIYYITAFSFEEVARDVRKEWKEEMGLESSNSEDRLQRDLEENNVEQISNYIKNQSDMFFNSLVLAVYNGNPQWREIRIEYENNEHYDMGILELTDQDKIFPVDGQHRVEGIRKIIESTRGHKNEGDNYYNSQTIPVILIAHENTIQGKKRTRRLFTTLNRYAKPVNKTDIILLDEDDLVAIITRRLMDNNILFSEGRLLLSQTKSIPKNDRKSFTNIQTLYDSNLILLKYYLSDHELYINTDNNNRKKVNPKSKKDLIELLKFRRDESEINSFYDFVNEFWNILATLKPINMFLNPDEYDYIMVYSDNKDDENENIRFEELFLRGPITQLEKESLNFMLDDTFCPISYDEELYPFKEGGNLLFRPFGLISIVNVLCDLAKIGFGFDKSIVRLEIIDLSLSYNIWNDIIYKISDDRMITNNKNLFESILKYLIFPEQYQDEDIDGICNKILPFWINMNELKDLISKTEESEKINVEKAYKQEILQRIKTTLTNSNYLSMYKMWKEKYCIDD